jgi:hypothetical protein
MERKQAVIMVLLGLVAGILGGYIVTQFSFKAIKAQQFLLVDKKGQIHAMLGLTSLGQPSLGLWDENGKNRIMLGFIREGVPGVGLNDEYGNRRANLQLAVDGQPALILLDENGQQIWSAPPTP